MDFTEVETRSLRTNPLTFMDFLFPSLGKLPIELAYEDVLLEHVE